MSLNSDKYQRAVGDLSAVVDAVPAGNWSAPSPCAGWTARELIGHLIGGFQRVSSVETGFHPGHDESPDSAGDDPAGAYAAARDAALGVLTEENLAKNVQSPMGEIPLDQQVGMFSTPDVLIHTWDLARAVGIEVKLDADLVQETYAALLPLDEMIRAAGVFGPKVETPAGADPQTALLCFTGRQP
ncbi:MAG TPA: TIGR03086 family metal-binding protein [Acidimicrobiales bacterium]|nr:TIGR03086 family metal-binding protein [Acidimicrobiales bacterium]